MKEKVLAIILCMCMIFSQTQIAFAATTEKELLGEQNQPVVVNYLLERDGVPEGSSSDGVTVAAICFVAKWVGYVATAVTIYDLVTYFAERIYLYYNGSNLQIETGTIRNQATGAYICDIHNGVASWY